MDIKSFIYGILTALIFLLVIASLGFAHLGRTEGSEVSAGFVAESGNIPEKCQVPAGQDINSWKEHLGHHSETKECLKYFS